MFRHIMKTIPTIRTADSSPLAITRATAAYHLRRERADGNIMKLSICMPQPGYLLTSQKKFLVSPRLPKPVMPTPFSISVLLTHKWATGWNHLDESHDLGSCVTTREKSPKWTGESFRQFLVLDATSPYRPRNIMRAIRDTLQHGCRCEHDCCGHIQSYVLRIRHLGGSRYAVILGGYMNV